MSEMKSPKYDYELSRDPYLCKLLGQAIARRQEKERVVSDRDREWENRVPTISGARQLIREAFESDPEFKHTYTATVSLMIYDELGTGLAQRNKLAEEIIDRIFSP